MVREIHPANRHTAQILQTSLSMCLTTNHIFDNPNPHQSIYSGPHHRNPRNSTGHLPTSYLTGVRCRGLLCELKIHYTHRVDDS